MPIIIPKTIPAFSTLQVRITLLATQSYIGKNTPQSHLERFYKYFSEIAHNRFDGAIITGAPIEHLEFEEVQYWSELREIMFQWRSSASVIFSNWLNLVYQDTPFLLKNHSQ